MSALQGLIEQRLATACASRNVEWDDPLAAFEVLRKRHYPWLLDSALPSKRLGRYSFVGADPYLVLRSKSGQAEVECVRSVWSGLSPGRHEVDGDPLDVVRALLPPLPVCGLGRDAQAFPFIGGALGYLGYELTEETRAFARDQRDDLGLPDLVMLFVDRVLAFDHVTGRTVAFALGFGSRASIARARAEEALGEFERRLRCAPRAAAAVPKEGIQGARTPAFFDELTYGKAIETAKEAIAAGNVYQVCLTQRMERRFVGDGWEVYKTLRRINPAPFASYFELPEVSIVGSSPERFLKVDGERYVESRPIKGTRPRGRHPEEDEANRRALAASEKERAENLMIVDLVRNDLGRVCETGSVAVPELMTIEAYASVFQMVSTIAGRLRQDRDIVDLIRAAFPPGSMTGAPKISAMKILAGLEPVRRSVYSGALGYFDVRGGADLSVVIRTLLLKNGRAYIHSGGGIVADSEAAAEYRETLDKARLLFAALERK